MKKIILFVLLLFGSLQSSLVFAVDDIAVKYLWLPIGNRPFVYPQLLILKDVAALNIDSNGQPSGRACGEFDDNEDGILSYDISFFRERIAAEGGQFDASKLRIAPMAPSLFYIMWNAHVHKHLGWRVPLGYMRPVGKEANNQKRDSNGNIVELQNIVQLVDKDGKYFTDLDKNRISFCVSQNWISLLSHRESGESVVLWYDDNFGMIPSTMKQGTGFSTSSTGLPALNVLTIPSEFKDKLVTSGTGLSSDVLNDKICSQSNPNPAVEQFRNSATRRLTIYRTPNDQTGYRYANSNCDVGGFGLSGTDDGDGSGSGGLSGSGSSSRPNLKALDTWVSYGLDKNSQRVTSSEHIYLGTPLWCQMLMENASSNDISSNFYSECYLSVGKKFDGWDKAVSLDSVFPARTKGLEGHKTKVEYQNIDAAFYPQWYNVVSRIDSKKDVTETNEDDNTYNPDNPFIFQIWGRPNITVSLSTDKSIYALGDNVHAVASFANVGKNPFGKTAYVDWYVDGVIKLDVFTNEHDRILRENLHPGMLKEPEDAWLSLPQEYGTHEIKVCLRFGKDDLVEEENPADNCDVHTVTIPDPIPTLVVAPPPAPTPPQPPVVTPPAGLDKGVCPNFIAQASNVVAPKKLPAGKYAAIRMGKTGQRVYLKNPIPFGSQGLYPPITNFNPESVKWLCWQSNKAGWEPKKNGICPTRSGILKKVLKADGTLNYWTALIPFIDPADHGSWSLRYADNLTHWVDFNVLDVPNAAKNADSSITYGYYKQPETLYDSKTKVLSVLFHEPKLFALILNDALLKDYSKLTGRVLWQSDEDGWTHNLFTPSQGVFQCDGEGSWELKIFNVTPGSLGTVSFSLKDGSRSWLLTQWFKQSTGTSLPLDGNGKIKLSP